MGANDIDRLQWLQARKLGIGGSDAGTILGVNPYKQPLQLYLEKRGEIEEDDIGDKEAVIVGHDLEDYVAQRYSQRTGLKVERYTGMLRHPNHAFMLGNVDRLVWQDGKRPQHKGEIRTKHGLECKTALARFVDKSLWGPDGTDEVPMTYLAQCQHYMAVTGAAQWDLAVLMAGPEFRVYTIMRDDDLIVRMIEQYKWFWQCVESGTPPDMDYSHGTTPDLLAKLYPGTDGSEILLPDSIMHWHSVMQEAAALAKEYDEQATIARNHIKRLMGSAAVGRMPDGSAYTRKEVKRGGYSVEPCSYIEFRFKKAKEAA